MLIHTFEDVSAVLLRTLGNQNTQNLQALVSLDTGTKQIHGFGLAQVRQHLVGQLVGMQLPCRYRNNPAVGPAVCAIPSQYPVLVGLVIHLEYPLRPPG
ncbi:hypothetical protein D3C77_463950 [compost metagenome]